MIKELLKELLREELSGESSQTSTSSNGSCDITQSAIGKYVIVRSRNEGINAGYLEAASQHGCVLNQARRLWYHKPAEKYHSWYEGVSISGLSEDSKISAAVKRKFIMEDYSITICSKQAKTSIEGKKSHEQS